MPLMNLIKIGNIYRRYLEIPTDGDPGTRTMCSGISSSTEVMITVADGRYLIILLEISDLIALAASPLEAQ